MGIFSTEDVERLERLGDERAKVDKELFFSYFEDVAVNYYIDYITQNKEYILSTISSEIHKCSPNTRIKIPLARFFTFKESDAKYRHIRREYQDEQLLLDDRPTSYFTSMSGIHITDLRAIYYNSNFRERIQNVLGCKNMSLYMQSVKLSDYTAITEYSNTLFLCYTPKYT